LIEAASEEVALGKFMRSSAKRRWVMGVQFLALLIPFRRPRIIPFEKGVRGLRCLR
jgi:hypothetical protein